MKAFSIAVAVTLVLAFVSVIDSATVPLGGQVEEVEEVNRVEEIKRVEEVDGSINTPAAERQDLLAGYWMTAGRSRQKRQSPLSLCFWCCNCCRNQKGCGMCCRF